MELNRGTSIFDYDLEGLVTGMIIDTVKEAVKIPSSAIESTSGITKYSNSDYAQRIARFNELLQLLVDISRISTEVNEGMVRPTRCPLRAVPEGRAQQIERTPHGAN